MMSIPVLGYVTGSEELLADTSVIDALAMIIAVVICIIAVTCQITQSHCIVFWCQSCHHEKKTTRCEKPFPWNIPQREGPGHVLSWDWSTWCSGIPKPTARYSFSNLTWINKMWLVKQVLLSKYLITVEKNLVLYVEVPRIILYFVDLINKWPEMPELDRSRQKLKNGFIFRNTEDRTRGAAPPYETYSRVRGGQY